MSALRGGMGGRVGMGWRDVSVLPALPFLPVPLLDLHRLPHHALERPALAAAQRTRLDDLHRVARLRFALLVVHHELRRALFSLAVQPVPHVPFDGDHDALLHLIADDDAGLFAFLSHRYFAFCRRNVFTRARSRRTDRIFAGASSCPIDFWIRSRNN